MKILRLVSLDETLNFDTKLEKFVIYQIGLENKLNFGSVKDEV